ncbi:MAG: amidohydrolase [Gordonia sp. (in: high G+C Gram-positive bacteria)]
MTTQTVDQVAELKTRTEAVVQARSDELVALSHAIHANPELSWEEHEAAAKVAGVLRDAGFAVEVGAYGVPTAIEAVYGDGDLTVAVCSEYDALPGIGHACGHNMIAAAGVGAALALADVADQAGLRVKLLGTPAEEHGGGKVSMLLEGAWEDVDFSMMTHGMSGDDRPCGGTENTAVGRFQVIFTGKPAHAAAVPEAGVNALSAASVGLHAMALLRQHLLAEVNLNAFISSGGEATNIIPERAVVQVEVRARDIELWQATIKRVLACFEGGAIATGCTWTYETTEHPYAPVRTDPQLADLWNRNATALGRELTGDQLGGGSTDMGNVSQVVPAIHPMIAFRGETAVPHTAEFHAAAVGAGADEAVIDAAIAMAWTVVDVALDTELRAGFRERTAQRPVGATRTTLQF